MSETRPNLNSVTYFRTNYEKAQFKFNIAALSAFAIVWFDLDESPSILGFKFSNVDELQVEIASISLAAFFMLNYWIRFLSEKNKINQIDEKLSHIKKSVEAHIHELSNQQHSMRNYIKELSFLEEHTENALKKIVNLKSKLSGSLFDISEFIEKTVVRTRDFPKETISIMNELNKLKDWVESQQGNGNQHLSNIDLSNDRIANAVNKLTDQLEFLIEWTDKDAKSLISVRKLTKLEKIHFYLFDIISPVILSIGIIASLVFLLC